MKNSAIVQYHAKDEYEFITDMFYTTKEMSDKLGVSQTHCRSILCRNSNHKGYRYERVWLKEKDERLEG